MGDERELSSSHRRVGDSLRDRTSFGTFPVNPMTGRDRTAEFLSVVKLLQTRQVHCVVKRTHFVDWAILKVPVCFSNSLLGFHSSRRENTTQNLAKSQGTG